ISCFMAGVQNVVAPQGTALTANHARILKSYVDEVVLCFDSDNAGQNATIRSLDSLLAWGLAIRVATVPAPHDPDSFIKHFGGEAFQKLTGNAEGFFDFYLNRLCATNDTATDKGRVAILQSMAEAVRKTGNAVLLDKYAQKTAMRLSVSADSVRAEFRKYSPAGSVEAESESDPEEEAETTPPSPQELMFIKVLLHDDAHIGWAREILNLEWITHRGLREIVAHCFELRQSGEWINVAAFLTQLEKAESRRLLAQALADERPVEEPERILKGFAAKQGVVEFLRDKFIERQFVLLNQQMGNPDLPENELHALWKKKQDLVELKKKPFDRLQ
ncbi:MAG: toprim domain-containing protein, partial [Verrucomicrobiota bacterium]